MMKRYVTIDDFNDVFIKILQRGIPFVLSKFQISKKTRTKTAFDKSRIEGISCWDIPLIQERWNTFISGNKNTDNVNFIVKEVLKDKDTINLLSVGSGTCDEEIRLAESGKFNKIVCVDFSQDSVNKAKIEIAKRKLQNIKVICKDIHDYNPKEKQFDAVLFIGALHHFKEVGRFLSTKIMPCLKKDGILIIDEYIGPNRLQYPKSQIETINQALSVIPRKYRKIYKTPFYKKRVSGSGLIRMIIADPSECIDSESILPSLKKRFTPIIERPCGGNIVMFAMKDIAHHFWELNTEKIEILKKVIQIEDQYIIEHKSDYLFGVYKVIQNKKPSKKT